MKTSTKKVIAALCAACVIMTTGCASSDVKNGSSTVSAENTLHLSAAAANGGSASIGDKSLDITYEIEDGQNACYYTGERYTLEKQNEDGSWTEIPFSENTYFNAIAHEVSNEHKLTISVPLHDEMYTAPLEAGQYRVVREMTADGVNYEAVTEFILTGNPASTVPEATTTPTTDDTPDETDEVTTEVSEETAETEIPEETETSEAEPEQLPLDPLDIMMEISFEGNEITTDTESFTLEYTYTGSSKEYCFGAEYTIMHLNGSDWETVPFAENAGFNSLGYIIGADSTTNRSTVSLADSFYSKPLTAGTYKVVKPICDDVVLEQVFEIKNVSDSGLVVFMESGKLDFEIAEVQSDRYICKLLNPYPADYHVMCTTSDYTFQAGDTISVSFAPMYKNNDTLYTAIADSIAPSEKTNWNEPVPQPQPTPVKENSSEELRIVEITADGFICSNAIPLPYTYTVKCNPTEYSDFCVGDYIIASYKAMYEPEENEYVFEASKIEMSDFVLDPDVAYKPVIYLYPEEETAVSVKLDYNGTLLVTDPQYGSGWNVTASPNGRLVTDGKEYNYLFWEGRQNYQLDTDSGFCISGEDTEQFLIEKLQYLGLNEAETAEFMEFWLPHMSKNAYNIIRFHGEDYTDNAELIINPLPDTVIRVYMTFTPCDEYTEVQPQQLEAAPERNGFTVVEWGGGVIPQ